MPGYEESDGRIHPWNPPNKAACAVAEAGEGRRPIEGNVDGKAGAGP